MSDEKIVFVSKEEALELHHDSIEKFGGSHGLRDRGAFESALNTAENRHHYENANLTVCAGTYAFHLCQAHAFVDGNKRIAAAVSILLLRRNGAKIEASIKELIELFLKIAAGEITREAVEQFFAENVKIQS